MFAKLYDTFGVGKSNIVDKIEECSNTEFIGELFLIAMDLQNKCSSVVMTDLNDNSAVNETLDEILQAVQNNQLHYFIEQAFCFEEGQFDSTVCQLTSKLAQSINLKTVDDLNTFEQLLLLLVNLPPDNAIFTALFDLELSITLSTLPARNCLQFNRVMMHHQSESNIANLAYWGHKIQHYSSSYNYNSNDKLQISAIFFRAYMRCFAEMDNAKVKSSLRDLSEQLAAYGETITTYATEESLDDQILSLVQQIKAFLDSEEIDFNEYFYNAFYPNWNNTLNQITTKNFDVSVGTNNRTQSRSRSPKELDECSDIMSDIEKKYFSSKSGKSNKDTYKTLLKSTSTTIPDWKTCYHNKKPVQTV